MTTPSSLAFAAPKGRASLGAALRDAMTPSSLALAAPEGHASLGAALRDAGPQHLSLKEA